jgi:hypothetical protein
MIPTSSTVSAWQTASTYADEAAVRRAVADALDALSLPDNFIRRPGLGAKAGPLGSIALALDAVA